VLPAASEIGFSGVHLAHLRLRDFRNYARLDADFAPGFHLLLGDNAQGKTNILEAVCLMATLRSFCGVGWRFDVWHCLSRRQRAFIWPVVRRKKAMANSIIVAKMPPNNLDKGK
jgi:predicted ATPase